MSKIKAAAQNATRSKDSVTVGVYVFGLINDTTSGAMGGSASDQINVYLTLDNFTKASEQKIIPSKVDKYGNVIIVFSLPKGDKLEAVFLVF
jgi:alkanesulfonate monooxygenase SsuD/methylene tetrahydromethanopterin reductase-like flavin-dependent oxidoreductase (luciferase family)